LDLGDVVYATGIGVRAGSELTYDVSRREGRFEAWAGIDPNVSAQRSGRFRVYADGNLVFDSGVIDQAAKRGSTQNPTRPIRVVIPLAGVTKLRLTFQSEDEQDKADLCGGRTDDIRSGRSIQFDKLEDRRLCNLHLALAQRMGCSIDQFGNSHYSPPTLEG